MDETSASEEESSKLTVNSLIKLPIISIMEHSDIPWAVKDNQSRFIYINETGVNFLGLPPGFDFEGKGDEELPISCAEYAEEFKAHDRKAESSKDGAEIIVTSDFWRKEVLEPYYCPKFPIYNNEGDILGTVFYAKKFSFVSVCDFFSKLKPSVITLTPPVDTFSEKELDIIFYAIQKLSSKEIASKLFLSHRTVENRLSIIYNKINVHSLSSLIEYCHTAGLHNYVPKRFLREGVDFFW